MNKTPASIAVLFLVVGTVVAAPAAGVVAHPAGEVLGDESAVDDSIEGQQTADAENASENASIAPGAQLSGVVGVQKAEIEGDVERRSLGIAFGNAETNESKAEVLANQLGTLRERLAALKQQKRTLKEALRNGSISRDQYRAEIAAIAARTSTVSQLANQTNNASSGLPADVLEANGVNATAIQRLKTDARNLSGPEVAAIARSVAGPDAGKGFGPKAPGLRGNNTPGGGPPGDAGPQNQSAGPGDASLGGANSSQSGGGDRGNDRGGNASQNESATSGGNTTGQAGESAGNGTGDAGAGDSLVDLLSTAVDAI